MFIKQQQTANRLSTFLTVLVTVILFAFTALFAVGQINANRAIVDAGKSITQIMTSDNPAQRNIDYTAALSYLEAAQQAYSENSVVKITSLIYALSTTIILGYGTKILHLGASDKLELCQEILTKTEEQFTVISNQMLRQQNDLYTAMTACGNASHLCFLLQSNIELSKQLEHPADGTAGTVFISERLQIELMKSLQRFHDLLCTFQGSDGKTTLNSAQLEMLKQSWSQASKSIDGYRLQNGTAPSLLEEAFGPFDQKAVDRLLGEIERNISALR